MIVEFEISRKSNVLMENYDYLKASNPESFIIKYKITKIFSTSRSPPTNLTMDRFSFDSPPRTKELSNEAYENLQVPSAPMAPEKAFLNLEARHSENIKMDKMRQFDLGQKEDPSTPVKNAKVSEFTLFESVQLAPTKPN